MGRLMSALKAEVASVGARMGSMLKGIPGMSSLSDAWNGIYGGILDGYEWSMQQVDNAWNFTRDAAVHVAEDVVDYSKTYGPEVAKGVQMGLAISGKVLWNNPISNLGKNAFALLTGDNRPSIRPNKTSTEDAKSAVQTAKEANPAKLAAVKAAYIKDDPELVERFVNAKTNDERDDLKKSMSPKALAWISTLTASDLWSMQGKSAVEISAHMAGDKIFKGVQECKDYYSIPKGVTAPVASEAPKPEPKMDKSVTERRMERDAKKRAKRDAANNVTPEVAGTVPGQAPKQQPQSGAAQEVMAFFGPRVAKEEEISPYGQSSLPAYRPPVPIQRKA